jgi:hypothetical protein
MFWVVQSANSHWLTSFNGGVALHRGAPLSNVVKSVMMAML